MTSRMSAPLPRARLTPAPVSLSMTSNFSKVKSILKKNFFTPSINYIKIINKWFLPVIGRRKILKNWKIDCVHVSKAVQ